jgi:hypothetical protein
MARDRAAYDASAIDWERLRRYAKRVAREATIPKESPLTYQTKVHRDVTENVRVKGFLGFGGRVEQRTTSRLADVTETAIGEHWKLDCRRWMRELTTRNRSGVTTVETNWDWMTLALLPDGALMYAVVSEEEVVHDNRLTHVAKEHRVSAANDSHIMALDFARRYSSNKFRHDGTRTYVESDRDPDKRLIRHAKGVGVNLLLKQLLDGRRPDYYALTK